MSESNGFLPPAPPQQPPLPPRAQQPGGGPSKAATFEEVSRLFTLPIAEAAASLGVCTSVLKRICRQNGIARWPYRQFLAGKTMEEIQKEAAREKSRALSELTKVTKPVTSSSTVAHLNGSQPHVRSITHALSMESSKLPGSGFVSHQQSGRPHIERNNANVVLYSPQSRTIPNFIDEFKYGFPSEGLSHLSNKWWGSGDKSEEESMPCPNEEKLSGEETVPGDNKDSQTVFGPESRLSSLRKRHVKDGHALLRLGLARGYCPYKLNAREKSVLLQVFHTLPGQWK